MTDFEKCTKITFDGHTYEVECILGFWGVESKNKDLALNEAMHYFLQYREYGEYSSIIGGKTVIEVLGAER